MTTTHTRQSRDDKGKYTKEFIQWMKDYHLYLMDSHRSMCEDIGIPSFNDLAENYYVEIPKYGSFEDFVKQLYKRQERWEREYAELEEQNDNT